MNGKIAQWAEEECEEVPEEEADAQTMIQYTLKIVSFTVRAVYCSKPAVSKGIHYGYIIENPMMMMMMMMIIMMMMMMMMMMMNVKQSHDCPGQDLRVPGG